MGEGIELAVELAKLTDDDESKQKLWYVKEPKFIESHLKHFHSREEFPRSQYSADFMSTHDM